MAASAIGTPTQCGASFSPSTSVSALDAAAFPLAALPGFFVQGDLDTTDPQHYAPRLGLLPKQTWSSIDASLDTHQAKLLIFLRHGEALHNADKARVGVEAWETQYQFMPDYIDAPLTSLGIQQAVNAGEMLEDELRQNGLSIDLVVVSPLDRTLYTFMNACGKLPLDAPVISMEIARETLGVCPCDQRKPTQPKREAFPSIDFTCVPNADDEWWRADHRESDDEIDARARHFIQQIFATRREKRILIVTHSGFTRACLRVLGHRYYRPANGEFVPVVVGTKRRLSDEL